MLKPRFVTLFISDISETIIEKLQFIEPNMIEIAIYLSSLTANIIF